MAEQCGEKKNQCLVKEEIDPLTPGPSLDSYLWLKLEKQICSIKTNLSGVTRDILPSEKEQEDLLDQEARLS